MRRISLAILALATSVSAALAANPASPEWIGLRAALWEKACLKPALGGTSFTTAATFADFSPTKGGQFRFRNTEIVASRVGSGDDCACLFTFGTTKPDVAALVIIDKLISTAASKFVKDEDPKTVGILTTPTGSAVVQIQKFKNAGADWLGVTIKGRGVCAI